MRHWKIDLFVFFLFFRESASVFTSARPGSRLATPAGSSTVWSTASSLMARWISKYLTRLRKSRDWSRILGILDLYDQTLTRLLPRRIRCPFPRGSPSNRCNCPDAVWQGHRSRRRQFQHFLLRDRSREACSQGCLCGPGAHCCR